MSIELVEGWTAAIEFHLKTAGSAQDLTGATVVLSLFDREGVQVCTTGAVTLTSSTGGKLTYTPSTCDLNADRSPYSARFKVTDAGSKVSFFPSAEPDEWVVRDV